MIDQVFDLQAEEIPHTAATLFGHFRQAGGDLGSESGSDNSALSDLVGLPGSYFLDSHGKYVYIY